MASIVWTAIYESDLKKVIINIVDKTDWPANHSAVFILFGGVGRDAAFVVRHINKKNNQ